MLVGINMIIVKIDVSSDKTKKYYFRPSDSTDVHIEACLLNLEKYGYIICVSSQIGCAQACKFCAASKSKLVRNLSSFEIAQQVQLIIDDNPQLLDEGFEVTYMGSGEPLSNYKNVFDSIDILRAKYLTMRKANISTTCPTTSKECFETISWEKYKNFLHFQYSLHFPSDTDRFKYLWPNLLKIADAIEWFNKISTATNDVYKINYIPFDKINDTDKCVTGLREIMGTTTNAKLKISKMCEICDSKLFPSKSFESFAFSVKEAIGNVEVFHSDGTDVNAGCGQFYNDSIV